MFKSLTPTLSIIASIILVVFFTEPQINEIRKINEEIVDYKETTKKYNDVEKKIEALKAEQGKIALINLDRLDTLVPDMIDTTRILVDVEELARSNRVLFGNVTIGNLESPAPSSKKGTDDAQVGNLIAHDISFEVIGTYEQFKAFLKDMEGSLSLMEITNLSFTASEGNFHQFYVTMRVYALGNS